ncbi:MAG: thiamine-phosphate kinase, partial [Planctomycetota bacterium]
MSASNGWSEERVLAWLSRRPQPECLAGSWHHDAAVLRARAGRPVTCTDQAIEGVHAELEVAPRKLGAKAVARTLSDLAATAATPVAVSLGLRAPREREERWLKGVITGAAQEAERHGAALVAGDLSAAPGPAGLTVTAHGLLPGRRTPPGRDRARPGQALILTGPVGGSRLGRHLRIEPRLAAGRQLWLAGATGLMDVSDGLALDLHRLARASDVAFELHDVPIHRDARRAARASGRTPLEHALGDGEDHELLACLP